MKRSNPLKRRTCRRIGHDWGPWLPGGTPAVAHRDCERCNVRELRYLRTLDWKNKRQFERKTLSGRLKEWYA